MPASSVPRPALAVSAAQPLVAPDDLAATVAAHAAAVAEATSRLVVFPGDVSHGL